MSQNLDAASQRIAQLQVDLGEAQSEALGARNARDEAKKELVDLKAQLEQATSIDTNIIASVNDTVIKV